MAMITSTSLGELIKRVYAADENLVNMGECFYFPVRTDPYPTGVPMCEWCGGKTWDSDNRTCSSCGADREW